MTLNVARARQLLAKGDLRSLFVEELGWDWHSAPLQVTVGGSSLTLAALAHKRGMVAYQWAAPEGGRLPDYAERRKIEHQVAKSVHEHLIVFTDAHAETQIWQWVKREPGKPAACREHAFHKSQSGDGLLQKLQAIAFTLEEEEQLSLPDVTRRARSGFDVERVTKRFYDRFQKEHAAFLKFIAGITERADHEWYASVMLNRLMFVYFIQRKGFLDGDSDYLRNRLKRMREEHGKDKFYSFYRYFLLRLFHEGLGGRKRSAELEKLVGRIPYLNGGLFDVHELEKDDRYGKAIEIPDKAFERIFDFFDAYQWHLDERPLRKDDEINPDVLGYIFEKYINQKQMGAYYTKEDITEYIGKNTVLPFLLDAARSKCKVAFENPKGPTVWDLLKSDPDRYIYPAVRHGVSWDIYANEGKGAALDSPRALPPDIAAALNPPTLHQPVGEGPVKTLELRKGWNRPAPPTHALPTETWRELIARRKRYEEVRAKLGAGEVREVSDLITLNLDIRQFVQDAVESCEGPDLLRAFWHAIEKVTVLDPTCGSGAFLFAALNILEPLYEACLDRMEAFVGDLERSGEKHRPEKYSDFRKVLANVAAHPNRRYFIFKSIILNNLFGVDIMEEAVEICKLRLFLKLAAQVEPDTARDNLGIEPLPDIDFNIRAGNTLVGYATYDEVKRALSSKLAFDDALEKISVKAADLQQAFDAFRARQVEGDGSVPTEDKQELRKRLSALGEELNWTLAGEYGVSPSKKDAYAKWLKSHQPFHWFVEFYGIVHSRGGFDICIGNPPYVEYAKIRDVYQPRGLATTASGNLYGMVVEVAQELLGESSRLGMILPMSLVATPRMKSVRDEIAARSELVHLSHYSGNRNPSVLFEGVEMRLTIALTKTLGQRDEQVEPKSFSTDFRRWASSARPTLFDTTAYVGVAGFSRNPNYFRKIGFGTDEAVLSKLEAVSNGKTLAHYVVSGGDNAMYAHRIASYFVKALTFVPRFSNERDGVKRSEDYKVFILARKEYASVACCLVNSSLFYMYYIVCSDAYHCGRERQCPARS
ncbi:MAG: Eco57I restriction-modification methylase domain-containing protein [Betaproteobacteria bacterium]|nr:Eco57I restriction-modification methylase domain-containing protein [Betaproteobacteria bacterium]